MKSDVIQIAEQVLAREWDPLDDAAHVNFDAQFVEGREPYFLNIWNRNETRGLGHIVFYDFLDRVGKGNTFVCTDFTDAGKKLFSDFIKEGVIEEEQRVGSLGNLHRFKVVKEPLDVLRGNIEQRNIESPLRSPIRVCARNPILDS